MALKQPIVDYALAARVWNAIEEVISEYGEDNWKMVCDEFSRQGREGEHKVRWEKGLDKPNEVD